MKLELFIADSIEFDSNPTGPSNVRWFVIFVGLVLNEHSLDARRRRNYNSDVAVVVMIE